MELQTIQSKIYEIRGQKVMLDFDLAALYEVETRALNQAVQRNLDRFPEDFMFHLTVKEWDHLKSQFVTSSWGGRRKLPSVFTEHGVTMLASVLKSKKAIEINIQVVRAFILLRQYALSHKDLTDKLKKLERKYNKQFKDVYEALNYLLNKDKQEKEQRERQRIGFKTNG
ncbi:MAG: ORF6N domain-containing protein [Rhabdochlamydiaceae bacterium]